MYRFMKYVRRYYFIRRFERFTTFSDQRLIYRFPTYSINRGVTDISKPIPIFLNRFPSKCILGKVSNIVNYVLLLVSQRKRLFCELTKYTLSYSEIYKKALTFTCLQNEFCAFNLFTRSAKNMMLFTLSDPFR